MGKVDFADGRMRLYPGQVARIEINAPAKRNAMSQAMWKALIEICGRIEEQPDARVVLLSAAQGEGPVFSAGADISEFEEVYGTPEATRAYNALVRAAQERLRELPLPTIAVIRGACVGGGCGVALACDLRFADETACFAITPSKLGLAYSPQDTLQVMERIGPARTKDLLFSARLMDADEAKATGLIDRLVPAGDLEAEATAYAQGLTGLSAGSIQAAKAIINGLVGPEPADRDALQATFEACFESDDFIEGRRAFLERRKPEFK